MLGALWYVQRRLTRGGTARRRRDDGITVVSRQGLGGKAQLVVVEVEGTRYVLGVTEQGVSVVDRTRAPQRIETASPRREPSDVVSEFERLLATTAAAETAPAAGTAREASGEQGTAPLRRDRRTRRADVADGAAPADLARRADPLAGSILSPGTWRQTAQALRRLR